jgi:hypothetical protein
VELTGCLQRNHIYLYWTSGCNNWLREHMSGNPLPQVVTWCPKTLQIWNKNGFRISLPNLFTQNTKYLPKPNVHTMFCKNGTQISIHLEQASKIYVDQNCRITLSLLTNTINLESPPIYFS